MMGRYGDWGYGYMSGYGLGWISTLIFWAVIVWIVYELIKYAKGRDDKKEDNAMRILRERYAKGEISKEEFEARKKDLV